MLYKKIHRQFLREFREGRRTSYGIVIRKPYIKSDKILIDVDDISSYFSRSVIDLINFNFYRRFNIVYRDIEFIGWDIDIVQDNMGY